MSDDHDQRALQSPSGQFMQFPVSSGSSQAQIWSFPNVSTLRLAIFTYAGSK